MRAGKIGFTALVGAACLFGQYVVLPEAASAAGTAPVAFGNAVFNGYGTGDELHLGALNTTTVNLANVDQAVSAASTASPKAGGLTTAINDPDTNLGLQPAQSSAVNAYGTGTGLEAGLGTTQPANGVDPNQVLLAGKSTSIAPPNSAEVTHSFSPGAVPGLGTVGLLDSAADTLFDSTTCPLGQPISYAVGDAASASIIDPSTLTGASSLSGLLGMIPGLPAGAAAAGTGSLISTAGNGTSTAHTDSETYLNSNGDGTFGLATQARETIAPLTINLGALAGQTLALQITVSGENVNSPVTLTTTTTGNASGATGTLTNDAIIGANFLVGTTTTQLIPPTSLSTIVGQGGITEQLSLSGLTTALNQILGANAGLGSALSPIISALGTVTSALPNASLGSITLGTPPTVTTSGGTAATADFNIATVQVGGTTIMGTTLPTLLDLAVGHLHSTASDAAPILCPLPVIKTASSNSITAGNDFVYTIEVPDPAKLDLLACSLANVGVVDTMSDNSGQPTFQVVSANDGGIINQSSANNATITWSGLTYTVAPVGSPPNAPITLTISVHVPANSPSGQLLDNVVAQAVASGCNGGASGISNLGGVNGTSLTGSYTLAEPSVTAVPAAAVTSSGSASSLPVTGGEGGLWQPALGLGALALGGAGLLLVRRSRRRQVG